MKKIKKLILAIFLEFSKFLNLIITNWPDGRIGNKVRSIYWKYILNNVGNNSLILSGATFNYPHFIEIQNNVVISNNVKIYPGESKGIYIGNEVSIADDTYLRSANHVFSDTSNPIQMQNHSCSEIEFNNKLYSIVIEDDVWIGAKVILLTGTHIGKGSIISAGSVISNIIPPYSIVVGNPGRVIKNRKNS